MKLPKSVEKHIEKNCEILKGYNEKLATLYKNCYGSTIDTALEKIGDEYFVLTGDIPAMWLRDSSAQVNHYVELCDDKEVAEIVKGVIKRQLRYILIEPYANAFNIEANGNGMTQDRPKNDPWVWERKYETDSLCYPIKLLYRYFKKTGDREIIDTLLPDVMKTILKVFKTEQHHFEQSEYRFFRDNTRYHDTIHNNGMGEPVGYTGMTWAGFRPSDDACTYGYYVPDNMFAVVTLGYAEEMLNGTELSGEIKELKEQIKAGIENFAVINHEKFGKVYACEVDGLGNHKIMDDANVPSLMSIPYLGFCDATDEIYQNTRRLLLSNENPYYYEGKFAKGIGSPHTPEGYIWHIALSMQGLTSIDKEEKFEILNMLINTDGDTGFMHEGFDANDPKTFSRPWFTWSNSLFCEFVESCIEDIKNK